MGILHKAIIEKAINGYTVSTYFYSKPEIRVFSTLEGVFEYLKEFYGEK